MTHSCRPFAAVALLIAATPLFAGVQQCDDPLFQVSGADTNAVERTCKVAARARAKLATCGVTLNRPIEFQLRDRVEGAYGDCLGLYHCGEDRIEILAPSAMSLAREDESAFAAVSDSAYWESVIVHELTHAAYDAVTCPFSTCVATTEYASYAMQVWSLPDDEKVRFGEGITLRTKPTRDAISAVMLFMSPNHFALLSWLHFQSRPEPCAYMQHIMEGQIFFDREPL